MHLLAARPGIVADGSEAVDLGQTPGDIVFFSAADTELACLAQAQAALPADAPSLRLANLLFLGHNLAVDKYIEDILQHARFVIVRLLGGARYWPYGIEQVSDCCRRHGIALAVLPGDDQPDPELTALSTLGPPSVHRLWQYCVQGGPANARNLLLYAATLIGRTQEWREPATLLRAGLHWPSLSQPTLDDLRRQWPAERAVVPIVFYRALLQSGDLAPIDSLIAALAEAGLNPLPVYVTSLKEPVAADLLRDLCAKTAPTVVLNATAFALSQPAAARSDTPFDEADCPVLQVVFASGTEEAWRAGSNGLNARDIAMHVALPEVDGRILSRAVAFKAEARRDPLTQCPIVTYRPLPDRIAFVATLAAAWARLRTTPPAERRLALILANYPNRDGRIGNGVGLDTPAGTIEVLRALRQAGYRIDGAPKDGASLMSMLLSGPTNKALLREAGEGGVGAGERLALADYRAFLESLPERLRARMGERWGGPERDPFFSDGAFHLPAHRLGNIVIAHPAGARLQHRSRRHLSFARSRAAARLSRLLRLAAPATSAPTPSSTWASTAISNGCRARRWRSPRNAGRKPCSAPLPHLYPFIVNDPGEGAQAKRRSAAVIIDHLTPPLTRAESYGPLRDLEALVDEYYEAAGLDPRRLPAAARSHPRTRPRRPGSTRTAASRLATMPTPRLASSTVYLVRTQGAADPRRPAHLRRRS